MPLWLQHLLVFALVAICLGFIGWQGVKIFTGRRSKIGSCCTKGCATTTTPDTQAAPAEKVSFIPLESLARRK